MGRVRIRTKLLLVLLLISSALGCASLLIVRQSVENHVRQALENDLVVSISTFQDQQQLREKTLIQSAQLVANLPSLKALMTTSDVRTIDDAANDFWHLSGSDIFVLTNRSGNVVALRAKRPGVTAAVAHELLRRSVFDRLATDWWFGSDQLYQVAIQPIYFGSAGDQNELGLVVVGYEIDRNITDRVGAVARGEVAFCYNDHVVISSIASYQIKNLRRLIQSPQPQPTSVQLGKELFLVVSVGLSAKRPVRLTVLKSFDEETRFLKELNRLLLALGTVTVLLGCGLVVLLSNAVTGPLSKLLSGVHALQSGDYSYPVIEQGSQEVVELARAFGAMRDTLHQTQQALLQVERMATIGRMAGSISHDMRHHLSAIFANAEFLCTSNLGPEEREELFLEIRTAVNDMTDLMDSMLEFSRTRQVLHTTLTNVVPVVEHAIKAVKTHPEYRNRNIALSSASTHEGYFDAKRLERVFYNLLLNAAEAVAVCAPGEERVEVTVVQNEKLIVVQIADNGPGIPAEIQQAIFDPFVAFGKEHGTGLGLTIARKIMQDHGGDVTLESGMAGHTVFAATLPVREALHAGVAMT
jgi:signal transduction histidine kinase